METYLGDGVYASYNRYNITLDLRAQSKSEAAPYDVIVMEPPVLNGLLNFLERIKNAST